MKRQRLAQTGVMNGVSMASILNMLAVIKTGGKQYKVKEGEKLEVEKIEVEVGSALSFVPLLVADEAGENVKVGKPEVQGAKVEARVLEHGKGDKVHVIKFHRKVRYKRNVGHRQPYTKLEISKIEAT